MADDELTVLHEDMLRSGNSFFLQSSKLPTPWTMAEELPRAICSEQSSGRHTSGTATRLASETNCRFTPASLQHTAHSDTTTHEF